MGGKVDSEHTHRSFSRRNLFQIGAVTAGGLVAGSAVAACSSSAQDVAASSTTTTMAVTNPQDALARLMAGNARFDSGEVLSQGQDATRRAAVSDTQTPYAVILSCSDSRVAPEIVFDDGIGDLFIARVAGNTATTPLVQGTIEYAISSLGSVLIMVLGHENCGAVKAALGSVHGDPPPPGQIGAFVEPIIPAAQSVQSLPSDQQLNAAIQQNARNQCALLKSLQPIIAPEISSGKVNVVAAEYELVSGKVLLLN